MVQCLVLWMLQDLRHRETIYKWIENKNMPGHQIGRNWKFKKEEVDAWVKSGKAAE